VWWEYAVVIAAVAGGVAWIVRRVSRAVRGNAAACGGCSGCGAFPANDPGEDGPA